MRTISSIGAVLSAWTLAGCTLEAATTGGETADANARALIPTVTQTADVTRADPPNLPAATAKLLLFSEAGLWGDSMVRYASPTNTSEAVSLIPTTELESAHLYGRLSSFQLVCGTRDATVVLYAERNVGTSLGQWSEFSVGETFGCSANQTISVNLHQQAPNIADRVGSVYLVSHATEANQQNFSSFVVTAWNTGLDDLPDGASAEGNGRFKILGSDAFSVRQFLRVNSWQCAERGAIFGLRARMRQDRTFDVGVTEVYVDEGTGDGWGCHDEMVDAVRDGAHDAAARLAVGLADLTLLVGPHPRYYFVPGRTMRDFDLVGGGERIPPPIPTNTQVPTVPVSKP